MVNRSHITDTKMDEDEYVETSDVEELDDAYALRRWRDFDDVDLTTGGQLTPVHSQAIQPSPRNNETLRKRRKVIYILFAEFSTEIWSA